MWKGWFNNIRPIIYAVTTKSKQARKTLVKKITTLLFAQIAYLVTERAEGFSACNALLKTKEIVIPSEPAGRVEESSMKPGLSSPFHQWLSFAPVFYAGLGLPNVNSSFGSYRVLLTLILDKRPILLKVYGTRA